MTELFRIAIVGSRNFYKPEAVRALVRLLPKDDVVIVSGGCPNSPDQWAEDEAKKLGIKTDTYPAEWSKYGKKAGVLRNREIVHNSHVIIAFWDGKSLGTEFTIDYAKKHHENPPFIYKDNEEDIASVLNTCIRIVKIGYGKSESSSNNT